MNKLTLLYAGVVVIFLVVAAILRPEPEPVVILPTLPQRPPQQIILPANYQQTFVHYATVDRADAITRNLYIHPDSLAQLEAGQPLPEGTQIIIEAYDALRDDDGQLMRDAQGRLIKGDMRPNVHIAEKRDNWSLTDLPTSARVGDWNFASFDTSLDAIEQTGITTFPHFDENLNDCFTCHDNSATPRLDFVFTRRDIDTFARTGEPQYILCNLPERVPCRR